MPFKSNEIENAFISQSSRIIPFQSSREWGSLLCSGSFHLSEVIFTEQTGRLIINLHLRGQNLNSPPPSLAVHPPSPLSHASAPCYPWSALGFISAEHLFQWLSLPLLSTAVRVKSRALSLDWNHLSHGPRLELISAEARLRYTAVSTAPLTQGAGQSSHRSTQMATVYYTATIANKRAPPFSLFACKLKGIEMGDWNENINGTCSLGGQDKCHQEWNCFLDLCLSLTVQNCHMSDRDNDRTF